MRTAAIALTVAAIGRIDNELNDKLAADIVGNMTLDEKVGFIVGLNDTRGYVGAAPGLARLGIPPQWNNDGPQGFRTQDGTKSTTQFPAVVAVSATWDPSLVRLYGASMGAEFAAKGANVQLGPGVNVARVPRNGRNFEYVSGEDPFLGSALVPHLIRGIQSNGVAACVKHYVNNNQETNRDFVSEDVDERTRMEVYLPPFAAAADAGAASAMCSYNKVNGIWACENAVTLGELKGSAKEGHGAFKGWVMSDWHATHHHPEMAAAAGLDQEMPTGSYGSDVKDLVETGRIPITRLDDMVRRQIWGLLSAGVFDADAPWRKGALSHDVTSEEHSQVARRLASSSAILLKNADGLLPLPLGLSVAVIGEAGGSKPVTGGGGSGSVDPKYQVSVERGLRDAGYNVTYFADGSDLAGVRRTVAAADVAVVVFSTTSREGADRPNLDFDQKGWNVTLHAACAASRMRQCVLVAVTPGPIILPPRDDSAVTAVVLTIFPGQEAGHGLADVLRGTVNPSARLPVTIPVTENQINLTQRQWPGVPASNPTNATYSERLAVGYKWFHAAGVMPNYAFGHGLSYTKFRYSDLAVHYNVPSGDTLVSFSVTNVGMRDGDEVAQVYLTFDKRHHEEEPPVQLRGFHKVHVNREKTVEIEITVAKRWLSTWVVGSGWQIARGTHTIHVGGASDSLQLSKEFTV